MNTHTEQRVDYWSDNGAACEGCGGSCWQYTALEASDLAMAEVACKCFGCHRQFGYRLPKVERWVRSRGEARRVRVVTLKGYRPRCAHCHVYVVNEGHPALR